MSVSRIPDFVRRVGKVLDSVNSFWLGLYPNDTQPGRFDIAAYNLARSCRDTSKARLTLILNGHLYEAEILGRSVAEGTCKFVFLCIGGENERIEKSKEYLDILPELSEVREQRRIREIVRVLEEKGQTGDILDFFRACQVPEERYDFLRSKYKRKRQSIEQRWGYVELVKCIAAADLEGIPSQSTALFSYTMSSHLLHQDGTGLRMRMSQHFHPPEKHYLRLEGFAARLLYDCLESVLTRLSAYKHAREYDPKLILDVLHRTDELARELMVLHSEWQRASGLQS